MNSHLKKLAVLYALVCTAIFTLNLQASSERGKFEVKPLTNAEQDQVSAILKPFSGNWVPKQEVSKYPELYWQRELRDQSFHIKSSERGLEDVFFVPISADFKGETNKQWSQSLSLLLIDVKDPKKIAVLPAHPILEWNAFGVKSVAFRDLKGNGEHAIIVNAEGDTGIGAGGAELFSAIGVYLPAGDGTFKLDDKLQKFIDDEMYTRCKKPSCRSTEKIIKAAQKYFSTSVGSTPKR
jgi:hypothetical protein